MKLDPAREARNMRIWSAVQRTDPDYVKEVNMGRRRFSAVDAYYKVGRATRQFGPAGEGWGWVITERQVIDDVFLVWIELWWDSDARRCSFPVVGAAAWRMGKERRVDADAPKKALTDAITKGLSYLGVSADVFLGKFDDNKYVQLAREWAKQDRVRRQQVASTVQPSAEAQAEAEAMVQSQFPGEPDWSELT